MSEELEQTNSETGQEQTNSETGQEQTNSETGQEEQTNSETGQTEEGGDSKNTDSSHLYARMKKAEEENKKNRAKLASYESQEQKVEKEFTEQDPYELAKTVQTLKDYSPEEIDLIKKQAKALEVTPAEATQNEDVQAIINHRRQKAEKEQSNPAPTNRQQPESGEDFSNWTPQTVEEKFQDGDEESRKQIDRYYKWVRSGK